MYAARVDVDVDGHDVVTCYDSDVDVVDDDDDQCDDGDGGGGGLGHGVVGRGCSRQAGRARRW